MKTKKCKACGEEFATATRAVFCNSKCRLKREYETRRKRRALNPNVKKCVVCKRGFAARTNGVYCSEECKVEAARRYAVQYFLDNREKLQRRNSQYQRDHPEKSRQYSAKWLIKNPNYNAQYYLDNPEKFQRYHDEYYAANRDKVISRAGKHQSEKRNLALDLAFFNTIAPHQESPHE